ncbi:MAG: DEAD/DEAH box helicase family protein [Candidatus Eutrophobiaceae bacterium]
MPNQNRATSSTSALIRSKAEAWSRHERANSQSMIGGILRHIDSIDILRLPQKEAVETWLWIKFQGKNRKLADMVRIGLLCDKPSDQLYENHQIFKDNPVGQFLNRFFQDNQLLKLHRKLLDDSKKEQANWNRFLDELLHDFNYSNYLFSLPMGAGKTFLMAAFIYLDLHFSSIFRRDPRFAHNFVVLAPHSSKTAILPSLRTIKDFDPEWVLPKEASRRLRRQIIIEVLDSLSRQRRDKLHGSNPNLEKVNRLRQLRNSGLVFITNAEKVVLERCTENSRMHSDETGISHDPKETQQLVKLNALRDALSQLPKLSIILDEVHHSYAGSGQREKKLRQAINILNQHGHVNAVFGFSGTPYANSQIEACGERIKLSQIQDTVYYYPLNKGIGKFLKSAEIKTANIATDAFIQHALCDFFAKYDREYLDGRCSKLAIYCPSVRSLNEEILPNVSDWYAKNRPNKETEILRYYSKPAKNNRCYELPRANLALFNSLDRPHAKQRVILLVAVGKEGWDCKSLTAVALPRQKTPRNFVLQTTCRCLREVDDAAQEQALVYLSEGNYQILEKELRQNHRLSISDLAPLKKRAVTTQIRKPNSGRPHYKQMETCFHIVRKMPPAISAILAEFDFAKLKDKHPYNPEITTTELGKTGLIRKTKLSGDECYGKLESFSFTDFLYALAARSYGRWSEVDLHKHKQAAEQAYRQIMAERHWLSLHPEIGIDDVIAWLTADLMDRVEYERPSTGNEKTIRHQQGADH